jgi:hypothetical protein
MMIGGHKLPRGERTFVLIVVNSVKLAQSVR